MIKALFRKQMMESFSWLYFNRKNGTRRSGRGIAIYALLYLAIFGMLGYMFYMMSLALCEPLCEAGFGWLYCVLLSLVAIVLDVFGSVFSTYTSLYQAKDNDLLFSMPIPAFHILLMRLSGVYMVGLMYELIVMVPALIVWFLFGSVSPLGIVFSMIIPFVLSLFILTLSCLLGWVVALISSKVRHKSFITVALSLIFIGGYYYVYFKAYDMLTHILSHAENIAGSVKNILFPFYHMGLAAEGSPLSMLIFTGIIGALFAIVYLVLSRGFIKLATSNKGAAKAKYKERTVKAGNADSALLRKECKRFISSPNYMMNCGLGVLFMLIAAVALLIKGEVIAAFMPQLYEGAEQMIPLLITAALCMIASMNDISAPSVSLEGKNLWLVQVLPVNPWQVLKAKLKFHLIITVPPAAILTVCVLIVFKPAVEYMLLMPLVIAAFIVTMAMFGLFMNLKAPNLNWTNEVVPIKQSMSVTVTLFGGWAVVLGLGAVYVALNRFISPLVYLAIVFAVLLAAAAFLFMWLKNQGAKILSTL